MAETEGEAYEQLPPFARFHKPNLVLWAQIKELERKIRDQDAEHEDNSSRLSVMSTHFASVEQELLRTQQLYDQKQREIGDEEHMKQLADREIGRMRTDLARFEKQRMQIDDMVRAMALGVPFVFSFALVRSTSAKTTSSKATSSWTKPPQNST